MGPGALTHPADPPGGPNTPAPPPSCPTHGPGLDPAGLVGRRLIGLVASWFTPPGGEREPVLAVREGHHPLTGRTALELAFPAGAVRCDGRSGDLRVRVVG